MEKFYNVYKMALAIKIPEQHLLNFLLSNLVKKIPTGIGNKTQDVYCVTKDNEGNLRVPLGFAKQLWNLTLKSYDQLPRKQITCDIELGWSGDGIDRSYQIPTYEKMSSLILKNNMTFLSLYCGAGKTKLAITLFAELGLKTAVLTDSTLIFPQWVKILKENTNARFCEIDSFKNFSKKYGNKLPDADIYIIMVKCAQKMHSSILSSIQFLIVDEATYFMTPTYIPAILNFTPSYTLGLCAEIKRDDGTHKFLPYLFGENVIRQISSRPFTVYNLKTNYYPKIEPAGYGRRGPNWNTLINSLSENKNRNDDIVKLTQIGICKEGRIIIGCKRKIQVIYIYDQLKKLGESVATLMEDSKTFPQCRILVGIYKKMGKGVDVKNLCESWEGEVFNIAILAIDLCKPEQFVGRIFRHNNPIVFDMVDDYSTLRRHFYDEVKKIGRQIWFLERNANIIYTTLETMLLT